MFNDHLMTSLLLSADGGNKHEHIKQEHWVYRIWRNTKSLVYIYRVTSSSHTVWAAISSGPWDAEQSRYLDVVTPCSDLDSSQHFYFVVLQLHFHFSLESPLQHLHLSSWTEGWERERQLQNKDRLSKSKLPNFPPAELKITSDRTRLSWRLLSFTQFVCLFGREKFRDVTSCPSCRLASNETRGGKLSVEQLHRCITAGQAGATLRSSCGICRIRCDHNHTCCYNI